MSVRVAVSDPLEMFRHGVMACLGDVLIEPEEPTDLRRWAQGADRRVILLTVREAAGWDLLSDLCQAPGNVVVIAMLEEENVANYLRAIEAGAAGAMPRNVSKAELRAVFRAAVDGSTLLPTEVVQALAGRGTQRTPTTDHPSTREIGWLRDLANGVTVGRIAEGAGYSERMMFRLLRDLYARLGARNRTEALMLARERDWI
ncbi:helix-turn-helix domain-containing protein [Kibdelosporangium aridum]|uniref:DNA-binding response regulator, NarL/FixJ family, contains REC and HTH domains n=1 Tax=Kibdelosporangium aridum TaxID=2030 RepID=A0A1W2FV84_KIBAR|nr:response regulator transcription factor [Kibdelosporangium aridum]SMD25859.1 DNA-binding response regulator, NarL/FixJ family, contains REC and HTH domains [Kibdelosporangium aridum]